MTFCSVISIYIGICSKHWIVFRLQSVYYEQGEYFIEQSLGFLRLWHESFCYADVHMCPWPALARAVRELSGTRLLLIWINILLMYPPFARNVFNLRVGPTSGWIGGEKHEICAAFIGDHFLMTGWRPEDLNHELYGCSEFSKKIRILRLAWNTRLCILFSMLSPTAKSTTDFQINYFRIVICGTIPWLGYNIVVNFTFLVK